MAAELLGSRLQFYIEGRSLHAGGNLIAIQTAVNPTFLTESIVTGDDARFKIHHVVKTRRGDASHRNE